MAYQQCRRTEIDKLQPVFVKKKKFVRTRPGAFVHMSLWQLLCSYSREERVWPPLPDPGLRATHGLSERESSRSTPSLEARSFPPSFELGEPHQNARYLERKHLRKCFPESPPGLTGFSSDPAGTDQEAEEI